MKYYIYFASSLLTISINFAIVHAAELMDDAQLGLSKTSVFDVPTPQPFTYSDLEPEDSDSLPRAFPGAPPQVPHEIESLLPIAAVDNACLECHDKPRHIGKKSSTRAPMSESHYSVKGERKKDWKMAGLRYNCTQCHVPQAQVKPLVDNTFINTE